MLSTPVRRAASLDSLAHGYCGDCGYRRSCCCGRTGGVCDCCPLYQRKQCPIGCQVQAQGPDHYGWVLASYDRSDLLTTGTVTRNDQTSRQLHLHRACYPVWYPEPRGIESHQWQTDVSIVFSVRHALTCFLSEGGQPDPIWLEGWFEIKSDQDWQYDRCCPGLEGWSWPHQHDEDFVSPQRPRRPRASALGRCLKEEQQTCILVFM